MEIPYYTFLILYVVVTLFGLLFASFNYYHVFHYAFNTTVSVVVTIFFTIGFVLILGISGVFITRVDWSQLITINIGL